MTSTGSVADRLRTLGLELPKPPPPAAQYLPYAIHESLVFLAGQLPFVDGELPRTGCVGREVDLETGREMASLCALNALAVVQDAVGSLEDVSVRQLVVFVASDPSFMSQHLVADGASTLLVEVLGDRGRHARTAVATPVLPLNSPVEIQVTFGLARPGSH